MKKILVFLLTFIFCLSMIGDPVTNAAGYGLLPAKEGHITSGYVIDYFWGENEPSTITFSDYGALYVLMHYLGSDMYMYAYMAVWGEDSSPLLNGVAPNGASIQAFHDYSTGNNVDLKFNSTGYSGNGVKFDTNVPIFDATASDVDERISNYLFNGDVSGAVNADSFAPDVILPSPYNPQMSASGKNKEIGTADILFDWKSGFNDEYNWKDLSYDGRVTLNYSIDTRILTNSGAITNHSYTVDLDDIRYKSEDGSYRIAYRALMSQFQIAVGGLSETIDGKVYEGVTLFSYCGYYTSIVFEVWNCLPDNINVKSPVTNYTYSYLTGEESTNRSENSVGDSSSINNPNISGPVNGGSSVDSSTSAGNITINVTQNNNGNNDNNSDGLNVVNDNFLSVLDQLTNGIGGFINGIISPVTDSVTNIIDSVSDMLAASSQLGERITSGFGLLGNNGYLSMLGATFEFIPSEIWSIITLSVSSGCSLLLSSALINFFRR